MIKLFAIIAYISLSICFYTMNDTASCKWGAFGAINLLYLVCYFLEKDSRRGF